MSEESRSKLQTNRRSPIMGSLSVFAILLSGFTLNACKILPAPPPSNVCQKPIDIVLTPLPQPSSTPVVDNGSGNNNNANHGFSTWLEWLQYLFGHHSGNDSNSGTPKPQKANPNRYVFDLTSVSSLLVNPFLKIDSVDFDFQIDGHYYGTDGEINLDINGIQLYGNGNGRHYELRNFDSHKNLSSCRFHGSRMKVNGAEPLDVVMRRVLLNRGQLVVNVHGRSTQISNVTLEIKGSLLAPCTTPTPTPTPNASPTATPIFSPTPSPTPVATPAPTPQNTPAPTPIPAPQTTILSTDPAGTTVASTSMSINFLSSQSGSNFKCSLDGASATSCNSPALYSNLSNGAHQFKVIAFNTEGTADPIGASYSWTVNTTPPNVTITSQWPSLTNKTNLSISFTSSDAASYLCSIDGSVDAACTSPALYSDLGEGSHSVSVKAINSLGTVSETPATFQWSIDLTSPIAQLMNVIPAASFINTNSLTMTFSANETSSFQCNVDSMGYSPCISPFTLNSLADGSHSVLIRATDLAGNMSVPATYTWTVDTSAPMMSLGQITPPQGITNASNVAAEFSANELVSFNCSVDGAPAVGCSSPFITQFTTEGLHEIQIQAVDQAGNISSTTKVDWIMDFTLPTLNFSQMLPSPASYINANYFQAEILPSEQVVLSCLLNGHNLNEPVSPVQSHNLSEGFYHLSITGTDLGGNVSNAITHDFTVDLTPPQVSASASASATTTSSTMNTFTFSANESASFQCDVDGGGFTACASPLVVSGFADGSHIFQVQATDLAGNLSQPSAISWTVDSDTTPPIATGLTTVVTKNSVTVSWTTNEPATSKVNYGVSTATNLVTTEDLTLVTSHSVVVTGLNANTIYTVMAGGEDGSGNVYSATKKQIRTLP